MLCCVAVVITQSARPRRPLRRRRMPYSRLIASLHTSAGRRWLSRIRSSHRLWGRPRRRFHDLSGNPSIDRSDWQRRACWTAMTCDILAMWPKMELRRLTDCRVNWFATSTFQSCYLMPSIWRCRHLEALKDPDIFWSIRVRQLVTVKPTDFCRGTLKRLLHVK